MHCEPNSSFKIGCNSCRCTNDGKDALCSRKFCNPKIWNEDGSRKHVATKLTDQLDSDESEQLCEPHTTFKDYCNTCKCGADGKLAACTLMACDHRIWNKDGTLKVDLESLSAEESKSEESDLMCEPLSTYKDYCNTCRCSSDGKNAACTLMACDPSVWNKDGSRKIAKNAIFAEESEEDE